MSVYMSRSGGWVKRTRPAGLPGHTLVIGYKGSSTKPRSLEVKAWLQGSKVDAAFYSCTEYTALNEQRDDLPSACGLNSNTYSSAAARGLTQRSATRRNASRCYHG
jgi:hypothetical protein